jgi:hypothetical protein
MSSEHALRTKIDEILSILKTTVAQALLLIIQRLKIEFSWAEEDKDPVIFFQPISVCLNSNIFLEIYSKKFGIKRIRYLDSKR